MTHGWSSTHDTAGINVLQCNEATGPVASHVAPVWWKELGWDLGSNQKVIMMPTFLSSVAPEVAKLWYYEWQQSWQREDLWVQYPGGCFTNVSRAPQNILAKIHNTRNHIYGENFNLKICTYAQSKALGTCTKFQLEILITSTHRAIHKFRENFLESSRNVSETMSIWGMHK